MPMASMAQGAANYGGENLFLEKQSSIRHLVAKGTMRDQINEGLCLTLVLSWLSNPSPDTRVINGAVAVSNAIYDQGLLVQTWKADYSTVSRVGTQKLAPSQFWYSTDAQAFVARSNINQNIIDDPHLVAREARFVLCIQTSDYAIAHALGVRKPSNSADVYFYDPNYGAARLPGAQFHNFLADFFESLYANYDEWYITVFVD